MSDERENGTCNVAPVDLRDAVPTSENLSDLPTVEDTIDVAREDASANVPLAVPSLKEPGAAERASHELTQLLCRSWCCAAGQGAEDAHRKLDGHTGPPLECDFMFLSSRVLLVNPGLTTFNMMDCQSMAAALTVKAASETLVRFFLAMLDAWGRSDVKVLLRSVQEVTRKLVFREVLRDGNKRTLVERLRAHGRQGKGQQDHGRDAAHNEARNRNEGWRQVGNRSSLDQLGDTTLLLGLLQVSCTS